MGRFVNEDMPQLLYSIPLTGYNLYAYCNNNPITDFDNSGSLGWGTFTKALSYIFDLFVRIAQMAGNMSKEVADVVKAIKRAKSNGASKEWINLLKKKKKSLVSHKALGTGKINAIATLLGLFATIFPYLSYIKKISNGITVLAELLVDVVVEIISCVSNLLVNLVCKFIPYVGFLVGWALGYVVDIIISRVFNNSCLNKIKRDYANRIKGSSSFKTWLISMGKSMRLAF